MTAPLTALDRPNSYIGRSVPRPNAKRLLNGRGKYVTDIVLPRMLHAAFVRSPHAHARIVSIDVDAARAMPGVRLIATGKDLAAICAPWIGALDHFKGMKSSPQLPLPLDKAVWAGQAVVAVVAETRALAEDAAEAVHVTYEDAEAFARWAGKDLPTEAEWELAARGGLDGAPYAWGDELMPGGRRMANTWVGDFPLPPPDGADATGSTPVGRFPPNGYGLHDMIGNVWEWTADWWSIHPLGEAGKSFQAARRRASAAPEDLLRIPRRVLKGGSHLCAANHCRRYRPAARQFEAVDTSTGHIGFRCVRRG